MYLYVCSYGYGIFIIIIAHVKSQVVSIVIMDVFYILVFHLRVQS